MGGGVPWEESWVHKFSGIQLARHLSNMTGAFEAYPGLITLHLDLADWLPGWIPPAIGGAGALLATPSTCFTVKDKGEAVLQGAWKLSKPAANRLFEVMLARHASSAPEQ